MNRRLRFLKILWKLLMDYPSSNFTRASLWGFVSEDVFHKLSVATNITEVELLHDSDTRINESFNVAVETLTRDWSLLKPEVKAELVKVINDLGLNDCFDPALSLTEGDKQALNIRWDISDILFAERKKEAIEECERYGLLIGSHDFDFSPGYKFPEIVSSCTKIILELLRHKIEFDLAVVTIAVRRDAAKHLNRIDNRLRNEYFEFLEDIRKSIHYVLAFGVGMRLQHEGLMSKNEELWPQRYEHEVGVAAQKVLDPFVEGFANLRSKIPKMQPSPTAYSRVQTLIGHESYIGEVIMGDKFENIHHATIVNRSLVEKSFNKIRNDFDEETAQALRQVAEEINRAGNKDAADNFDSFNEELQKPEPKKSVLRTLWGGITTALPTILQMTDVVSKITKLFGS